MYVNAVHPGAVRTDLPRHWLAGAGLCSDGCIAAQPIAALRAMVATMRDRFFASPHFVSQALCAGFPKVRFAHPVVTRHTACIISRSIGPLPVALPLAA